MDATVGKGFMRLGGIGERMGAGFGAYISECLNSISA